MEVVPPWMLVEDDDDDDDVLGGKNEERTDADPRGESDAGVLSVGTPSGDLSWRCGGVRHVM